MCHRFTVFILLSLLFPCLTLNAQDKGLPEDFPVIEFLINDNPSDEGYLFLTPFEGWYSSVNFPPYMIIMDNRGTPIFYESTDGIPVYDFKVQPNGMISFYGGNRGTLFHLYDSLYKYPYNISGGANGTDFHELTMLDNGNVLMIAWDDRLVDMDTVVPGGQPDVTVRGHKIFEFTLENEVVREYNTWDWYEITDAYEVFIDLQDPGFIDYVHMNTIEVDSDTSLLLCPRNLNEITRIHRFTGEIIWRLGGKNNMFTFLNDTLRFSMPHDVRRLQNGNIMLFDNGVEHDPQFSSVIEYDVDEVTMTVTLVQRIRSAPDDIFGNVMGSAQKLDNGNILVGWGSGSPNVTEFRPDGTKALELHFEGEHYRVRRYPWDPKVFSFDKSLLNFGEVLINEEVDEELGITNNTNVPVEINSVVIFNEAFTIPNSQLPLMLVSGETGWITVNFTPTDTGKVTDVVTFCYDYEHQGADRRIARQITFNGEGYDDTGLGENHLPMVRIYPNPGSGKINIDSDNPFYSIRVKDLTGNIIRKFEFKPVGKRTLLLEGLPIGTYLLEFTGDNNFNQTVKYFIIE